MFEGVDTTRRDIFRVVGSITLLRKYRQSNKEITVYITDGKKFTGQLRWYDDYAIKIILPDGSVTIPLHNIVHYECECFLAEGEVEYKGNNVSRGISPTTYREQERLEKYWKNNELIHFYLKDGSEVRGRLQWYLDHVYAVKPDNNSYNCMITKRHILYYRKIEVN